MNEHHFLHYLAPIKPGQRFAGGFTLTGVDGDDCIILHFLNEKEELPFDVRILPEDHAKEAFLHSGRFMLSLAADRKLNRQIERFVRSLALIIERNTLSLSNSEFKRLFRKFGYQAISGGPEEKRIEILVGNSCPSNCLFCSDRPRIKGDDPPETAYTAIRHFRELGYESLEFGGLEPTSRPDFPELVGEAKNLGYDNIQVITNGFKVADPAYMERLFDNGLTVLILSIHAADETTETVLTGTPGLFDSKIKALETARKLLGTRDEQLQSGRFFRTNSVITKINLGGLAALVDLLHEYQSSLIPLNYPWINGRARENFKTIAPDYLEVVEAVTPIGELLKDPAHPASLFNLPPCVGAPFSARTRKTKSIARFQVKSAETKGVDCILDPTLTHPAICRRCAAREHCPGVSTFYLDHYGEKGLCPMARIIHEES